MRVRWMWEQVGAEVSEMSAQYHDEVLAAVSHLPHMLAFALVDALARLDEHDDISVLPPAGFTILPASHQVTLKCGTISVSPIVKHCSEWCVTIWMNWSHLPP